MKGQAGLEYAFHRLHQGEQDIVEFLLAMGDRHRTDHDVFYVAQDLAAWSRDNLTQLAGVASAHGLDLDAEAGRPSALSKMTQAAASLMGRRPEPGVLLLEDMRELYLRASGNSLAWEMLAQHAQAKQEKDVLELTSRCHPQTLRQVRWANTMLKTLSPQVLASL
jgi:hypothetical protein